MKRRFSELARKLLALLLAAVLCHIVLTAGLIRAFGHTDNTKSCDVGIVLGAAVDGSEVSEVFRQRLNHAAELYRNGLIRMILVSGGQSEEDNCSEAEAGKHYLYACGIPSEAILTEDQSVNTLENMQYSAQVMETHGLKTALIISDPLHLFRAMLLADEVGIEAYASPTTTSAYHSTKTKLPFLARETFFCICGEWYCLFT